MLKRAHVIAVKKNEIYKRNLLRILARSVTFLEVNFLKENLNGVTDLCQKNFLNN